MQEGPVGNSGAFVIWRRLASSVCVKQARSVHAAKFTFVRAFAGRP